MIPTFKEAKEGGSPVEGQTGLHSEFQGSLNYIGQNAS